MARTLPVGAALVLTCESSAENDRYLCRRTEWSVAKTQRELPLLNLSVRTNDTMIESVSSIRSLDELRAFIHKTLCQRENILEDQFGLTSTALIRKGRDCGLYFCLRDRAASGWKPSGWRIATRFTSMTRGGPDS